MIVTVDENHRLKVPAAVCETDAGEQFDAFFDHEQAAIVFRRIAPSGDWFDVMRSCPLDMDDLPPRGRELPKELSL